MKYAKLFISQRFKALALTVLTITSFSYNIHAADAAKGEKLFQGNCASCHFPDKDMTGPSLQGARERWIENSSEDNFYLWVQNSAAVIASGDAYANQIFNAWDKTPMTANAVSREDIDDIFEYVETYTPPVAADGGEEVVVAAGEEESSPWLWVILAGLFIVIIAVGAGAKKSLKKISDSQDGVETTEYDSNAAWFRAWAWNNRGWFGVLCGGVVIILLVAGLLDLMKIGVFEGYQPEQPIAFSHELHAGRLGVDCQYCHNSVEKSKHAGIPTVNVCMNCHKTVHEGSTTGTEEIAKIHKAAGYDATTNSYTGDTQPIEWVKVHNLPDHVYFNHSQHVAVGGLDCQNCHGNMKQETVARVMTSGDLNNVGVTDEDYDENEIKFTKPTLTMGWCVECHMNKGIDIANAPEGSYYNMIHKRLMKDQGAYRRYLEDDMISVADLGGIECAKCHY